MIARLRQLPRRTTLFYGVLSAAVVAIAVFAATSIYGTPSSASGSSGRTATVTTGTVQSSVSASGNVSSGSTSSAGFSTSGTLTSVRVEEGQKVVAGQVLATIDSTQAKANLASALASLALAKSNLATAEAGGTASQQAQAASSLTSAKLQLASAQQTLADNQATLAAARKQLTIDQRLGCIAAASTSSSNTSSGATTGAGTSTTTMNATRLTAASSSAPAASNGSSSNATVHGITLGGAVDPNGASTTYWFEYGTSTAYAGKTSPRSAGSGTSAVTVTATIGGLKEGTTYVYRLVAKNSHGTRYGAAQTFATATSACTADTQAIASATQAVTSQKSTVAQANASVQSAVASNAASVDSATVAQDRAQVLQDQIAVTSARKALAATTLRAPISGTVTAVNGAVGDTVGSSSSSSSSQSSSPTDSSSSTSSSTTSSSGLVTIENLKRLEVVASFPEADATKLAVGQAASVTLSALTDTEVSGTVTAVSPTATVSSNVVEYDATIKLVAPPGDVKVGMTADVSVYVATRSNVLTLPSAAITTVGSVSSVTLLESGKQTTKVVTTGLVGSSTTEIVSGLEAGDVVVEPTATVSTGSTSSSSSNSSGGFGGGLGGGGFGGPPSGGSGG